MQELLVWQEVTRQGFATKATSSAFQEESGDTKGHWQNDSRLPDVPLRKTGASRHSFGLGRVWQHRGGAGVGELFALGIFKPEGVLQREEARRLDGGSLSRAHPGDGRFAPPLNELQNRTPAELRGAAMSEALSSCGGFRGVKPLTCQGRTGKSLFCWSKSRWAARAQLAAKATNDGASAGPASDSSHRPRELQDFSLSSHPPPARSAQGLIRPGRHGRCRSPGRPGAKRRVLGAGVGAHRSPLRRSGC